MSEDKGPQIIIHKSNWGKQFIFAVIALVVFFALLMKNPSKSDFIQACVKEYLKKGQSMDPSTSNLISELTTKMFGAWFEPLVERDDFLIFSSYSIEIDNSEYKMQIKAFGIWGKIIFSEAVMMKKETVKKIEPKTENQNTNVENQSSELNDGEYSNYENNYAGFVKWAKDNGIKEYYSEDGLFFYTDKNGEWKTAEYIGDAEISTFQ